MRRQPAFTIIELMVTITIIILLLGVTTVYLGNGQAASRDTTRLSDVSLIAKMVDASTAVRRGLYPLYSDSNPSLATVCPDELSANSANLLDYSVFPTKGTASPAIPKDPLPVTARGTHCTTTANGYLYETKAPSGPGTAANALGRGYVLEVALENTLNSDESQFTTDAALPIPAGRHVYVLPGSAMP